jgi:hypothetical protein
MFSMTCRTLMMRGDVQMTRIAIVTGKKINTFVEVE